MKKLKMHDVGDGQCIEIDNLFIDCGSGTSEKMGKRAFETYILSSKDNFIVSHLHADHYNGLTYAARIKSREKYSSFSKIYYPILPIFREKKTFSKMLAFVNTVSEYSISSTDTIREMAFINLVKQINHHNFRAIPLSKGKELIIDGNKISVLWPPAFIDDSDDVNTKIRSIAERLGTYLDENEDLKEIYNKISEENIWEKEPYEKEFEPNEIKEIELTEKYKEEVEKYKTELENEYQEIFSEINLEDEKNIDLLRFFSDSLSHFEKFHYSPDSLFDLLESIYDINTIENEGKDMELLNILNKIARYYNSHHPSDYILNWYQYIIENKKYLSQLINLLKKQEKTQFYKLRKVIFSTRYNLSHVLHLLSNKEINLNELKELYINENLDEFIYNLKYDIGNEIKAQKKNDYLKKQKALSVDEKFQEINNDLKRVANNFSLAFYIEDKILFLGDLDNKEISKVVDNLCNINARKFDIVIAPHHGSHWDKSLEKLDVKFILSSNGKKMNKHFNEDYKKLGTNFTTFIQGAIQFNERKKDFSDKYDINFQ